MELSQPDYYSGNLGADARMHREDLEKALASCYENLPNLKGIARLKALREIDRREQQLSWQGANPKDVPFDELKAHVQAPDNGDAIADKYQARIRNRATAIRAYCVQCQGGHVAGVKECADSICPMHPFRMGGDPLRGWALPKAAVVEIPIEDDLDDTLFEEGDGDDDADATE
jgi:hypothetical protein